MLKGAVAAGSLAAGGALARRLARARWQMTARARVAFDRAAVPMARVDARTLRFVDVNPACCELLERPSCELLGLRVTDVLPSEDEQIGAVLAAGLETPVEQAFMRADGTCVWTQVAAAVLERDERGQALNTFVVLSDLTARREAEQALREHLRAAEQAELIDPLTALPNRTVLFDRVGQALKRRGQAHAQMALMIVDIDRFKQVNDTFGHGAGDDLLRTLAPRIRAAVRAGDTVARVRGDEFVILCEDLLDVTRDALLIARKVMDVISEPVMLNGQPHVITASVGVALPTGQSCAPDELLRNAEVAMHHAKAQGAGRCELFDDMLRDRLVRAVEIEQALRTAINTGELVLHYQPIVTCDDGQMVAVEALVRWQHPTRGLLGPAEFMDVAEDTGLVVPLGRYVLRAACEQAAAWQAAHPDRPPLGVTVNIAGAHVTSGRLAQDLADAVQGLDLAAGSITIEVTETGIMDRRGACEVLSALRQRAFRIALDDFGTGQSSLSRLRDLPLDVLKFDRSFVAELHEDPRAESIVAAVMHMAQSLNLSVVAEGVESEEQLACLRQMGCPRVQGYLTGRPAGAEDIDARLAAAVT